MLCVCVCVHGQAFSPHLVHTRDPFAVPINVILKNNSYGDISLAPAKQ